jgi:hypothetical protein
LVWIEALARARKKKNEKNKEEGKRNNNTHPLLASKTSEEASALLSSLSVSLSLFQIQDDLTPPTPPVLFDIWWFVDSRSVG